MKTSATSATPRVANGRYGFSQAARMEWIKLRSLRSTWLTLALTVAAAAAIAVTIGVNTKDAASDLTNNVLAGVALGLLLSGAVGVLAMTSEYSSGMIRATLTAKAAVVGAVALVVGEGAAFVAFLAGRAALPGTVPGPSFGQPGVLRAVVLAGAGFCLIGLIGLGLGAIIRHTGTAIAVLVGGVYLLSQFVALAAHSVMPYLPIAIVANSLTVVRPLTDPVRFLSPWAGLGVLCLYAAVTLSVGAWLLAKRDA